MRILIYSPAFYPDIGGIEALVSTLAREFVTEGHEVKVVTKTAGEGDVRFPFEVVRGGGPLRLLKLVSWCDIYLQPNISLRGLWPLVLLRRHWVASHQSWYTRADGHSAWQDRLKGFSLRLATGISASRALAEHVSAPSVIIPNAYQDEIFRLMPGVSRHQDLVFVARLVSDKGGDVLLDALASLKLRGLEPKLTIVGTGPEERRLRTQVLNLDLATQVEFLGVKRGAELAEILNAHRIIVVPSRWPEPFGIVALEGIACGCVVVGSEGGGLKDAIGSCGVTFPNGDAGALAEALTTLLTDDKKLQALRSNADEHLAQHRPRVVAKAYLQVFETALQHRNIKTRTDSAEVRTLDKSEASSAVPGSAGET